MRSRKVYLHAQLPYTRSIHQLISRLLNSCSKSMTCIWYLVVDLYLYYIYIYIYNRIRFNVYHVLL